MENRGLLAENISFSYTKEKEFIKNVSFALTECKITALIGANGCGKSTLFKLLSGALKPQSGDIYLDGVNTANIKRREFSRQVAAVHQYNTAPLDISVGKLVSFGRTPYSSFLAFTQTAEDKVAVETALKMTDTHRFKDRIISELSGGEQQRVWLALALAQSPRILLLDEITTYLDIRYRLEIFELIKKLNREHGLTVLTVVHDIERITELCDEVMVMQGGAIIAHGPTCETISENILDRAFNVRTKTADVDGMKYFVFNKGEVESYE